MTQSRQKYWIQVAPLRLVQFQPSHVVSWASQNMCRFDAVVGVLKKRMESYIVPTAKIAKDAKECVQECVSEFISFITSEAAEKCQLEKRKTVGGDDILAAMESLGFENYAETLKIHLAKLRQVCAIIRSLFLLLS